MAQDDSSLAPEVRAHMEGIAQNLSTTRPDHFGRHHTFLQAGLEKELAGLLHGNRGRILAGISDDTQMQAALKLLQDDTQYHVYLAGPPPAQDGRE
jgi:hypothetical protein